MPELSQLDINRLEKKVDNLTQITAGVNNRMEEISESVLEVSDELKDLANRFQQMVEEQKKTASLQQALTELVRVRQELEQNFGNYKVVRETMLGVLQATDLALVKKTTISRVSEELMLSTPKYWLAPCLVAVSAWIGNDRNLAERAIAEAIKRDEERTALTMALICRRNNKVQTCYEWLSIYFSKQDAANFSEGSFSYIDAYVNGIFGPDDKHMCDDYITKWINEIRGNNSVFEKEQEDLWKGYCDQFHNEIGELYPDLKSTVQEYDRINAYVGRINSVDAIADNFIGITNAFVDQERLKATIDKNLITLVSRYDEEEEPLRKEEEYLKAVKKFEGDRDAAKKAIEAAEHSRQIKVLNLVEQMTHVITTDGKVSPSERKTAVSFLSSYIKKGFENYVTEKKADFPQSITLNVNGWIGSTSDGSNLNQLCADYENYLSDQHTMEMTQATTNTPRSWLFGTILVGGFTLGSLAFSMLLAVILGVFTGYCAINIYKSKNDINTKINEINQKYNDMRVQGKNKICSCIRQWNDAKNIANEFNNKPIRNIIA